MPVWYSLATAGSIAASRLVNRSSFWRSRAGLQVAEVTEILRQQGDYKKAAEALSEGRTEEGFAELDKLGWIRQVPDADRYKQLADAYLSAVAEKKQDGQAKVGAGRVADPCRRQPDHAMRFATASKRRASLARNASSRHGFRLT